MAQGRAALLESPDGDIIVSQGAGNRYGYRWATKPDAATPDAEATPVALLTDGWAARAQLRKKPGSEIWLSLTDTPDANGSGITLTDAGSIVVFIDNRTTEDEAWNSASRLSGVWDLELEKPGTPPFRFLMGTVTISPDVTRAA